MNFNTIKKILSGVSFALILCLTMAGCTAPAGGTGASGSGAGGTIQFVVSIVILFAVFYFFMIRPESKKKKKIMAMRSALAVGDKIITIGGMMGKIVTMNDDNITFETGEDRVRIQVAKWAISDKTQKAKSED
ncbi:MAG: preprotein translocase subunit YajC [Oscillospiraceae bacterium]